jgi:hypothetical protein
MYSMCDLDGQMSKFLCILNVGKCCFLLYFIQTFNKTEIQFYCTANALEAPVK